jgi:hypothetical protein
MSQVPTNREIISRWNSGAICRLPPALRGLYFVKDKGRYLSHNLKI